MLAGTELLLHVVLIFRCYFRRIHSESLKLSIRPPTKVVLTRSHDNRLP